MKYEINKASLPLKVIRSSLDLLIRRKSYNRFLPSHIDPENAQEYWESLSFGSRSSVKPEKEDDLYEVPKQADFPGDETGDLLSEATSLRTWRLEVRKLVGVADVEEGGEKAGAGKEFRALFSSPSAAVQRYREMSRQGRLEYEHMKKVEKDMPKILLGHGVYTGEEGLESEGSSETDTDTNEVTAQS
jgi:hypothetical protein